ncbi:MAG: AMIN domain-containing protein [Candidatus Eremiobacteraeota bacterium]|nr:AMIN domain-containing protein [Candidatus Eremiobacteraeota bacterium]MBC5827418.1 AMIN domain-containing protein [Candidatus Eremiobacteraeota bacterium]
MHPHFRSASSAILGCAVTLGLVATGQPSRAANPITGLSYGMRDGALNLSLTAGDSVSTSVKRASVEDSRGLQDLIVDVSPATYSDKTKTIDFQSGKIREMRVGQLTKSPAVVRIVVESRGPSRYDIGNRHHGLTLDVDPARVADVATQTPKAALAQAVQSVPVWRLRSGHVPHAAGRKATVAFAPSGMQQMFPAQRNISLDVKNADILDVLKVLARQSGQNIITTQSVKGAVTVSLHGVALPEALDLIVRSNGLDYRKVRTVYIVGTPEDLAKQFGAAGQGTQTIAFPIRYADPISLAKQLATAIPATSFTVDSRSNTLLVSGSPEVIQSARNFLALADIAAPQVMFQVKVVDITRNANSNVGINFAGNSIFDFLENPAGAPPNTSFTVPATQYLGQPIAPQPFTRNNLFVQAQLNYLIQHNDAELLADPRITALDNQEAKLLVGETYPLVYYDPKAGQFQAQFIDIGVQLKFTPVINVDGYITTTLHTERSVITGLVQQFPILSKRSADSVLRVKDGDTIILGGMIDDETVTNLSKVPLLGDLPVFGALFRNLQKSKVHNEVVFFITPHIVKDRR